MQHNFTFINILKVIFDKYWGRGALMQSSQLLSDRLIVGVKVAKTCGPQHLSEASE